MGLLDFENRDLIQMAGGRLIPYTGWLGAYFVEKSYKENNMANIQDILKFLKSQTAAGRDDPRPRATSSSGHA